ncbi:unnamed protein product [Paramecium octaurelia]|uniref:Tetratricopeptide repeat protein n=1 Tax=Paramecium octaurelia TaxID=43137 RepID=A0A8S1XAD1_PAROT|nr:unnamed protein product [Paramecium octaurelia]
MDQINDTIKCPNSEHDDDVKLVCFNEFCKADRLYCMQCMRNGVHVSHSQYQQELSILFEHIESVEKECEDLIIKLNQQMDLAYQYFYFVIGGIRSKYQKSKQQFLNLDSKQKNSFFSESIKFKQYEQKVQILIEKSITDFRDQMEKLLSDLKLSELNYYQISNLDIQKSEELYKKGYKLYWDDDKYEEAIKVIDQALILNSKHKLSLWCKAKILKQLGQYNQAIIWADKALQIDPKHQNSLYLKADSLRMLDNYIDAIIWVDKALFIDSKHVSSFYTKGESLRMLSIYDQAIKYLDQALYYNPNHHQSLGSKGACLQSLQQYQEAIYNYNKAIEIDPNYTWAKDRKIECESSDC